MLPNFLLIISVKSVEERIVVCLMELILVEVVTWGVVVVFVAGASWPVRAWVVVSEVVVEVVGVVVIILIF